MQKRGEYKAAVEFVVVDEADNFTSEDPDHIINRLIKETRKFGLGMILAGQSFEQFSEDLLTSAAVKLVLGDPEEELEPMRRRLALSMVHRDKMRVNPLVTIKPKSTAFAGVKSSGGDQPVSEIRLT